MTSKTLPIDPSTTEKRIQQSLRSYIKRPSHVKASPPPDTSEVSQLKEEINSLKALISKVSRPTEVKTIIKEQPKQDIGVFGDFDMSSYKPEEIISDGKVTGHYKDSLLVNGGVILKGIKSIKNKPDSKSHYRKLYIDEATGRVVALGRKK